MVRESGVRGAVMWRTESSLPQSAEEGWFREETCRE